MEVQEKIPVRADSVASRIIEREAVIVLLEKQETLVLNEVGSRIWELLEQPHSFKNLVARLMDEYEISEQQCNEDTLAFVKKLTDKKLIETE